MNALDLEREANSGGPRSRTRTEPIRSTVLDRDEGPIRCPRVLTLALDFGDRDPRSEIYALLEERGCDDPESLRDEFDLPPSMLCESDPTIQPLRVSGTDPERVLHAALLLGLCTSVFYDPSRPVLWTRASLTRRLRLYDMTEFYA